MRFTAHSCYHETLLAPSDTVGSVGTHSQLASFSDERVAFVCYTALSVAEKRNRKAKEIALNLSVPLSAHAGIGRTIGRASESFFAFSEEMKWIETVR